MKNGKTVTCRKCGKRFTAIGQQIPECTTCFLKSITEVELTEKPPLQVYEDNRGSW